MHVMHMYKWMFTFTQSRTLTTKQIQMHVDTSHKETGAAASHGRHPGRDSISLAVHEPDIISMRKHREKVNCHQI